LIEKGMDLKLINTLKLEIKDLQPILVKMYPKNSGKLEGEKNEVRRDRL
jgi:hypothetical protein